MVTVLFVLVALVAYGLAALLLIRRVRGRRTPTQVPMVVILVALGSAFVFLSPAAQAVESRLHPSLGRLLSNVCTLVAAYGFLTLLRHVSHPPERVRAPWRLAVLLGTLGLLVVMFFASSPPSGTGIFTGLYREQPTLAVYSLAYSAYLGVALVDLAWLGGRTVRYARGYLRAGMVLVAVGCVLGLGYVAQKVGSIAGELAGSGTPAESLCGGPFAGVGCTFAVGMPALSVLAILLGAAVPALGPRLAALLRLPGHRRAYRRLYPLWHLLHEAVPEIALTSPGEAESGAVRGNLSFRLYRRVIEIRDGLLVLRPYRDGETTAAHRRAAEARGLAGAELDAAVEAADIMTALRRRTEGAPPADRPSADEPGAAEDLAGEVAWLSRVADAVARPRKGSGPALSTGR